MSSHYCGRFAPSPTGDLHHGSVVAALASWLRARQAAGDWLVRIEDIDPPREIDGASQRMLIDLAQLEMHSTRPVLWQSQRHDRYRAVLQRLVDAGHAFPCHCSRQQIAAQGGHHGRCRFTPHTDRAPAWRLLVPDIQVEFHDAVFGWQADQLWRVGDFVLWRQDGLPAYQLAVVVDDAAQGITEVVRGADLLDSTGRQILLQRLLGLPTPHYLHVPLVLDDQGTKLSKQNLARPIHGDAPLQVLDRAWRHLRQEPLPGAVGSCKVWLEEAAKHFQLAKVREGVASRG